MVLLCTLFVVSVNVVSCDLTCCLSFVPDLTLRHIDGHYSWDFHGIADMVFCITTFL